MSSFRYIFSFEDETEENQEKLKQFPNKVPRFSNKEDAMEFIKDNCTIHSNPDYPKLTHSVSTLISWDQIESYLFPMMLKYDSEEVEDKKSSSVNEIDLSSNRYYSNESSASNPVYEYLLSRLNLSIHQGISTVSRMNTLNYLFYHMKCGIYIMIRNNQLKIFCPFVNKDYRNDWNGLLNFDSSNPTNINTYKDEKKNYYGFYREDYLQADQWWANGNIICNSYGKANDMANIQYWGDHFLLQLKDMFSELCHTREVPDCDLFLNKRDYPQLKFNTDINKPMEPYSFIYDGDDRNPNDDIHLRRHCYKSYAPILSFYSSERFADIPIPPSEDWEAATGEIFPSTFAYKMVDQNIEVQEPRTLFTSDNLEKFSRPWEEKVPIALFRGTATGGGTEILNNQRLNITHISHEWLKDPDLNGSNPNINQGHPYLDAKIVGWNFRDKKLPHSKMTYIKNKSFNFDGDRKKNFINIYEQSKYKYLLYIEGHCAACRYGFMMLLNCVILKVDSTCTADSMWYFPLLEPYVDHVPVKSDLSNLREVLEWCHNNDDQCKIIAENARKLYEKYVSREAILDYLQLIACETARRSESWQAAEFCSRCPTSISKPHLEQGNDSKFCIKGLNENCFYCEKLKTKSTQQKINSLKRPADSISREEKAKKNAELRKRQKEIKL